MNKKQTSKSNKTNKQATVKTTKGGLKVKGKVSKGITVEPYFTQGRDAYEGIERSLRDVKLVGAGGRVVFEQKDVEAPAFWSDQAVTIAAQKYFRGEGEGREKSVFDLVDRIANTITEWGVKDGIFATEQDARNFNNELRYLLITQRGAFNSPVWFNVGIEKKPQGSACFILEIKDTMESILETVKTEGLIFKYGSGTGVNISTLRSSREALSGGGRASGPVSFMKGFDSFAGVIKSGGKTRRAAKMVIMNADHPDIMEFVEAKAKEERKAKDLIRLGYSGGMDGEAYSSVYFQNANLSVRVTDEFMHAVENDRDWNLKAVTTGETLETVKAKDLWFAIAKSAWECGDPGLQYHDTINAWHTCKKDGEIVASNPCLAGDTLLLHKDRLVPITAGIGKEDDPMWDWHSWHTGKKDTVKLVTDHGHEIILTPDHAVRLVDGRFVEAKDTLNKLLEVPTITRSTGIKEHGLDRNFYFLGAMFAKSDVVGNGYGVQFKNVPEGDFIQLPNGQALSFYDIAKPFGIRRVPSGYDYVPLKTIRTILNGCDIRFVNGPRKTRIVPDCVKNGTAREAASFVRAILDFWRMEVLHSGRGYYARLKVYSQDIARDLMVILQSFGIQSRIVKNKQGIFLYFAGSAMHKLIDQLGVPHSFKELTQFIDGLVYVDDPPRVVSIEPAGKRDVYDFRMKHADPWNFANGITCHNCSEFMFLNNSACNLASLNLLKFYDDQHNSFDSEAFTRATEIFIIAQDLIAGNAGYPTKEIEKNSKVYRPLGIGYANLGALIMRMGFPYDSLEGRSVAAGVTALMTGAAWKASAKLAKHIGPFERFHANRDSVIDVLYKHLEALREKQGDIYDISHPAVPRTIKDHVFKVWNDAIDGAEKHGVRNAQVSLLAPTGTIGLIMDVDSTGIEPLVSLRVFKALAGGGILQMVSKSVEPTLKRLGYSRSQIKEILEYVDKHGMIEDAPYVKQDHYAVFDTALKAPESKRVISYMGHLKMMAATQPFLSGAISKTVNLPREITVEEIADVYMQAWKMGLKAVALYRDGSKEAAPLTTSKEKAEAVDSGHGASVTAGQDMHKSGEDLRPGSKPPQAVRNPLPSERISITHKFEFGAHEGYVTVGYYENGAPGEIFVKMSKQGSTIAGLLDAFSIVTSIGLQHGVPLDVLTRKMKYMKFEPDGFSTGFGYISSVIDYVAKWLEAKHPEGVNPQIAYTHHNDHGVQLDCVQGSTPEAKDLSSEDTEGEDSASVQGSGQNATEGESEGSEAGEALEFVTGRDKERDLIKAQGDEDAPFCPVCGFQMIRDAFCHKCPNCGETDGCSG